MNILFVSDIFLGLFDTFPDGIHIVSWKDANSIGFGDYDAVVLDMTFGDKAVPPSKLGDILYSLKKKLGRPNYISKNNIVLIYICGEKWAEFEIEAYDYHESIGDEIFKIHNYEVLSDIVFNFNECVDFDPGRSRYSLATIPVHIYLDKYKNAATYLHYDFDHISDISKYHYIKPLARMKETESPCVAFECISGRGRIIILPSYDISDVRIAFSLIVSISKSYIKQKQANFEFIHINEKITGSVRDSFIEALSCFHNCLYDASILLCRKAIEECIKHLYKDTDDHSDPDETQKKRIIMLGEKIKKLFEQNLITEEMKENAFKIVNIGNWIAHSDKSKERASEDDAKMIIDFVNIFLNYFVVYPQKGRDVQIRIEELGIGRR